MKTFIMLVPATNFTVSDEIVASVGNFIGQMNITPIDNCAPGILYNALFTPKQKERIKHAISDINENGNNIAVFFIEYGENFDCVSNDTLIPLPKEEKYDYKKPDRSVG